MDIIMSARHTSNARINMIEWINIPTFMKWVQLVDVTPKMIKCFGAANAQVLMNTITLVELREPGVSCRLVKTTYVYCSI